MPRDSTSRPHSGWATADFTNRLSCLKRGSDCASTTGLTAFTDLQSRQHRFCRFPSRNGARSVSMGKRSISDVFLFFRVLLFAAAVPFLLRLKLSRLQTLLEPRIPSAADQERIEQIIEYVEMAIHAGRPLVRPGCLTRGVTRYYFFRRIGQDVSLCFGMGQVEEKFVGHCWLVRDGAPFLETRDPRPLYAEMYRISATSHRSAMPSGKSELEQSRS